MAFTSDTDRAEDGLAPLPEACETVDIVDIVRRRLARGAPIVDSDVRMLIEEIDRMRAASAGDDHYIKPDNNVIPQLVSIEGEDIVIRITPAALTFATEHGVLCTFIPHTGNFRGAQITDLVRWRDAMLRSLRREQKNGDTPVQIMLDACIEHALEQGEEGVWVEGVTE